MNFSPEQASPVPDQTLAVNLRRLLWVRWVAVIGEALVVGGAWLGLGMELPLPALALLILVHALINVVAWWRLQRGRQLGAQEILLQLALDVLVLALLLYLTGGASNPFVSLLLLPLVVAAAILPRRHVWTMALWVVGAYGVLMLQHRPMPQVATSAGKDFDWHVIGMWFGFLLAVVVIVFFVWRMAESLRERDRVLARAREQALRDEQLVALGTLAAGAAHELGTPLSTMAILTQELAQEYTNDAALAQRLGLLRRQVDRCKQSLAMISASSGSLRAEGGGRIRLDQFLNDLVEDWRQRRSEARLVYELDADGELDGDGTAPMIISEQGLRQALISLLDNAADSSPQHVTLKCRWAARHLRLEIADRGAGLPALSRQRIGRVPFSTKPEGQGLGLLLAHAIIQRLDGTVSMHDRRGGGTRVRLELPLARLLLDD